MPKYRVLAPCFLNNGLHLEGEIVEFDGPKGAALELVEGERGAPQKAIGFPKSLGAKPRLASIPSGE